MSQPTSHFQASSAFSFPSWFGVTHCLETTKEAARHNINVCTSLFSLPEKKKSSMAGFWNTRNSVIIALVVTLLGGFYIYQSPTPLNFSMSQSSNNHEVPGLEFKLAQVSRSPPTLLVTVKNTNPDTPYTLLKWATPLDSAALNTGVFSITKYDSGDEVKQMVLQINRMMPPPQEELITLAPGTQEELEVVFDKPWMPETKPAKYKVRAAGRLLGVWDRYGDDVKEKDLYEYAESPFHGRMFATNEVVMEVH